MRRDDHKAGAAAAGREEARDVGGPHQRDIGGEGQHGGSLARWRATAATASLWPRRVLGRDGGAKARGHRGGLGIERRDKDAREPRHRRRIQHVLEHGEHKRAARARIKRAGKPLLRAPSSFTGMTAQRRSSRARAASSAAAKTVRARASRSARVRISVFVMTEGTGKTMRARARRGTKRSMKSW